MSGVEIWGAVAGVIGTLDAIDRIKSRKEGKSALPPDLSKAVDSRRSHLRSLLIILQSNQETYKKKWEASLKDDARKNIEEIWKNIYETVMGSNDVAKRLQKAVDCDHPDADQITQCHKELHTNDVELNSWLSTLNTSLNLERPPQPASTPPSSPRGSPRGTPPTSRDSSEERQPVKFLKGERLASLTGLIEEDGLEQTKKFLDKFESEPDYQSYLATALLLACRYRKKDIVEYCLSLKAPTSIQDEHGLDAAHATLGTTERNTPEIPEILKILLDHGVDPSDVDANPQKWTLLHRASNNKDLASVKLLLEREKIGMNATDADGTTALWHACSHPNNDANVVNIVEELVGKGANFGDHHPPPNMRPMIADALHGKKEKK